ncbi:MAG: winged helix-turn-helix transcriptional regulator [Candidatus Riflebacteria bacterium]|nr:winged helix-turn-helix transcriptional regulator [Candidatus Riflebacteria bacterium]
MNKKTSLQKNFIPFAAEIFKSIGHPLRLKIFEALASGEKSVSELQKSIDAPQSVVSHQLKILKSGKVVSFRKEGTLSMYYLSIPELQHLLDCLYSCQDKIAKKINL